MIPRFKKSRFEPKPIETDYWIDLNENEYGGVFKYYDNNAMVWKLTESITKEREPLFTNSPAYKITTDDIAYWNEKVDYEDFDVLKEELLDLGSKYEGVTVETLEYYNSVLRGEFEDQLEGKADKAATLKGYNITDAYTKKDIDTKFTEWKVELPENVSYFKNDVGYVTEQNLADKLPDNIVSDANYVHTDNNFTNEYKNELDKLDQTIAAATYDDTQIKSDINKLTFKVEEDLNTAVAEISKELETKANVDDVYTRVYLDELFTQFVKKTHKTYGFVDDRPTNDLTITDTGFVFYDYTVNEPLLWVADEWRLLRTNESFDGYLLPEDIYRPTSSIGNWEFVKIDDDFVNLTKFIGEYTSSINLEVPNMYSGSFVLELGTKRDERLQPIVTQKTVGATYAFSLAGLDLLTHRIYYVGARDEITKIYPLELYSEVFSTLEPMDVFGNIKGTGRTTETNATSVTPYELSNSPVNVNSITLPQGIRKIHDLAFDSFIAAEGNDLVIPAGVEELGINSFSNSSITSVTFPKNPIKLGTYCFQNNPITSVKFPKTLDYDDIMYKGGGLKAFANGTATIETLEFEEGVKAIPGLCFYKTKINTAVFPKSLKYIGPAAFYESQISGALDTNNIETIDSFAFRKATLTSLTIGDKTTYIAPHAFLTGSNSPLTFLKLSPNLEKIYNESLPCYLVNCGVSIPPLPKIKAFPTTMFYKYGLSLTNVQINIELAEGLESLGSFCLNSARFNCELVLPQSLKYINSLALAQSYFTNTSLFIPKNVRVIGGAFNSVGPHKEVMYEALENGTELNYVPRSKNGYCCVTQYYEYLEDGGELSAYSYGVFYGFGLNNKALTEFKVDEENQWFKDADGVLFSKDGTRLVCYPLHKLGATYEIPEGCVYCDATSFYSTGLDFERFKTVSPTSDMDAYVQTGEDRLLEIIIPNTMINYTPLELKELFPTAVGPLTENMLFAACNYYSDIKRITVKEDNPRYKNVDDFLLSKDGTTLQIITLGMTGEHRLPDTVTTILPGAIALCNGPSLREIQIGSVSHSSYRSDVNLCLNTFTLYIPTSVVNMDDGILFAMNTYNTWSTCNTKFILDEGNPAFTQDSTTYMITRL